MKTTKTILLCGTIALLILLSVEVVLRKVYGFTDAVLIREDKDFEYIPVPQRRIRFGKLDYYNKYSQRNREINKNDSLIVLAFGDSVINGGTPTDQDSLATSLLTDYLSKKEKAQVLVANIGAGSWGPDNCYAYLKRYGNFHAKQMLLIVSSHDAYDNMNFEKIVGIHPSYPSSQYSFAVAELFDRYVYPRYLAKYLESSNRESKNDDLLINKHKEGEGFNSGFVSFKRYSDSVSIPMKIYLHADQEELSKGRYNEQGQLIIDFCSKNNVPLIKELDYGFKPEDYRDGIHLSERGQRHLFNVLKSAY